MTLTRRTGHLLLLGVLACLSGCASAPKLAWNPFRDVKKDRNTRFDFAQLVEREGNLPKAEKTYRQLQKEAPKDPRFAHRLGVVLVKQERPEEGLEYLRKAHELQEDNVEIINDLGYAHLLTGDVEQAETLFREGLKIKPRDARTINNLAMTVGTTGRLDEAFALFRRTGSEADAHANVAYLMAQAGDLDGALARYNRSLNSNPGHKTSAEALLQLAEMQREQARLMEVAKKTEAESSEKDAGGRVTLVSNESERPTTDRGPGVVTVRRDPPSGAAAHGSSMDQSPMVELLDILEPSTEPTRESSGTEPLYEWRESR